MLGPLLSPPVAEDFQQLRGEHDVTIFLPFAQLHANHHSSAINVWELQSDGLRDSQAGGIATGQDGAVFALGYTAEKL